MFETTWPATPLWQGQQSRESLVLCLVYESGGLSRTELGKALGLNQTAVIRLVAQLIEQGLLVSEVMSAGGRGRPTELIRLHSENRYALGLEFGRDHLITTLLNARGEVVQTQTWSKPPLFQASDKTMEGLVHIVKQVTQQASVLLSKVVSIGLALHDVVRADGMWVTRDQNRTPYDVVDYLSRVLGRTVIAEDVSRSFALTEHRHGAGKGCPDMVYVFVGHGVGGGLFVNNRLLKSSSGVCGEIGHVVVKAGGLQCHCGSQGCLETVTTHQAVVERFKELLAGGVRSSLSPTSLKFSDICRASASGDKAAYLVMSEVAEYMAEALAATVNVSGAPVVIIGGQLYQAGLGFLATLETALRHRVVAPLLKDIQVRYATLPPHAGAWGAGILALEQALQTGDFLKATPEVNAKVTKPNKRSKPSTVALRGAS